MKLIAQKEQDSCLGGSSYYELTFDSPWTQSTILSLQSHGNLEYHKEFARPYFQFKGEERYVLKGVQGEKTCTLIIPTDQTDKIDCIIKSLFG